MAKPFGRLGIRIAPISLFQNHGRTLQGVVVFKSYATNKNVSDRQRMDKVVFYPDLATSYKLLKKQLDVDKQFEYDHQFLQEETPLHEVEEIYYPPQNLKNQAFIRSLAHYNELYRQSMEEPNKFWKSVAKESRLQNCLYMGR